MSNRYLNYIDGEWVGADSGRTFAVHNPGTGEKIAEVPECGAAETRRAIEAAERAFPGWRAMTAEQRYRLLHAIYDKIMENQKRLAEIISLENGKPLAEAMGEVVFGANFFLWYAEETKRIYGETIPSLAANKRITVLKQPIGVVAAITPWNYPVAMTTRKVAAALAAGCTIVIKPSEETPLSAIELFRIFEEVGLPKGVANLVTGNPEPIGREMLDNPTVRKIAFTGSTAVGKYLMRGAAEQVKKVSLELGGHAPVIVFEDADLDLAVEGAMTVKFKNNGQTCVCGNRFFIHRSIMDEFAGRYAEKVRQLKVGLWSEPDASVGPLINAKGLEKVERQVADAVAKGAKVVVGGKRVEDEPYRNGAFFEPTVLRDVTPDMIVYREETFGPVAPLIPFDTEEEVIRMANDSIYGLAAYFFTNDASRVIRVQEALEYGIVGVNDPGPATAYQAPFGGVKQSGIGREGGRQGLEEFLETKYISQLFKLS